MRIQDQTQSTIDDLSRTEDKRVNRLRGPLCCMSFPRGNDRLSKEIDAVVY